MDDSDRYERATRTAEKFISDHSITTLPVDLISIARGLGIHVQPKPARKEGASGMLIRLGEEYAIAYATHIDNHGFQRFSIAHELGHYLLPGHLEAIFDEHGVHESFAGFRSENEYEKEADYFAAGLLMPNPMFTTALEETGPGLEAVEELALLCITSLSATATRYAKCADHPVAVIVSTGRHIDYCVMSDSFKAIKGLEWLRKRQPLPRETHTYVFNQDTQRVARADHHDGTSSLEDWFGSGPAWDVVEEIVGLGSYGKTLTVLRPIIPPEADDDEEEEFERNLIDSWTPKFRK